MKKFLCFLMVIIISGCAKSKNILFCEGVSPEGEGVNCGTKFETGDITAVIKSETPFETGKIEVRIYEDRANSAKNEILETIPVEVKPDDISTTATLSFYKEGKFKVIAVKGEENFAEAGIEVVER